MKVSRRKKGTVKVSASVVPRLFIMDEYPMPSFPASALKLARKANAGGTNMLVQQGIMRSNSGKRIRFISTMTWADGSPLKAPPKKFVPAQVKRRSGAATVSAA